MNTIRLPRSIAAVATAVACLILLADPAAATIDASIDGGVVDLVKTGSTESLDLSPEPPPPPPCPTNTITFDDGTGSTLLTTALSWLGNETFAGGPYLVKLTRVTSGNTAGVVNTTAQTITNMRVALGISLYTPQDASCSTTGATLVCSAAVLLNLSGTYTGTLGVGDTVTLTGTSVGTVVSFPTCTAGPSQILGMSATIPATDPLVLTVT